MLIKSFPLKAELVESERLNFLLIEDVAATVQYENYGVVVDRSVDSVFKGNISWAEGIICGGSFNIIA